MDSPTSRSLVLLGLLQSGRAWGAAELGGRLGVSARTVRRDVLRLRSLGYTIRSCPGPGGAYQLEPGFRIPPLLLASDEVTTLIAGLLVLEAWTPRDPGVAAIRTKLEQVLPPSLRRRAAATALTTQVIQVPTQPVDWELVGVLADAVAVGQHVRFGYTDQHDRSSSRWVEPHRHILREGHWYLIGYDVGRLDWRVFRLDRIRDVATVPGSGEPYRFPHPSIEQWLASDFGRRDARGSATVTE